MGVRFYDDALLKKINKWTAGLNMKVTGVNETKKLFETILDSNNDSNIKLPLIALSRPGGYSILNKNQRPLAYNGNTFVQNMHRGGKVNAIPIAINYQLDIYTRYLEEADEYARNFIFNIINYPKLQIELPYENLGIIQDANIRIISDVDDNSDIPERLISGQFTRLSIGLSIDDAYLFDVRIKDNISIKEIYVVPENNKPELVMMINDDK